MAGFDTTDVAAHPNPTVAFNPLGIMGQVAEIQNLRNQNRLFQGNVAAGQAYQGAIDPVTGQVDQNRFLSSLGANPAAAPVAQEYGGNALIQQGSQISNATNQAALGATVTGRIKSALASLGPAPTDPTQQTAYRAKQLASLGVLAQSGALGPNGASLAVSIAGGQSLPDGSSLADLMAKSGAAEAGGPLADAQFGAVSPVNTGGATQFENVNRVSGQVTPMSGSAAVVPNAQSPSEMGSLINYQGSDGSTLSVPKSAIQTARGVGIPNVKDANGNQITDASGALKVTLSPNDMAQINSTATNQADRASALQTAFEGSAARKALVQEMLATQGDFRSGPGAAKWSGIVTEANRMLGTNFDSTPASAQQVFGKIAEQLSAGTRQTLGLPSTNAGTEAAQIASPNSTYSPEANRQVLAQLAGNEDLLQAKTAAWNKYHKAGGTYNGFVSQFNSTFDPRSAWEPYMTAQQKTAMFNGMSPDQQQAYAAKSAKAQKLIQALTAAGQ